MSDKEARREEIQKKINKLEIELSSVEYDIEYLNEQKYGLEKQIEKLEEELEEYLNVGVYALKTQELTLMSDGYLLLNFEWPEDHDIMKTSEDVIQKMTNLMNNAKRGTPLTITSEEYTFYKDTCVKFAEGSGIKKHYYDMLVNKMGDFDFYTNESNKDLFVLVKGDKAFGVCSFARF